MPLGFPRPISKDDPRLRGHETDYSASRGGWVKREQKPVPGKPKDTR
ncbi:hypothetical protein OG481_09735 [Streptomyces longwoodensis]|nr:hypothetical protein [Streptomyces longwoodensis]WRY88797.1 hypothetical protein OG481_09735 [Streptomyces longwoodensis]